MKIILLFHCSYCTIFRYCSLFTNMCTIEVRYLLCFRPTLKKIEYDIVMILGTRNSAIAEGPCDGLVSRNSATTKYPI